MHALVAARPRASRVNASASAASAGTDARHAQLLGHDGGQRGGALAAGQVEQILAVEVQDVEEDGAERLRAPLDVAGATADAAAR